MVVVVRGRGGRKVRVAGAAWLLLVVVFGFFSKSRRQHSFFQFPRPLFSFALAQLGPQLRRSNPHVSSLLPAA